MKYPRILALAVCAAMFVMIANRKEAKASLAELSPEHNVLDTPPPVRLLEPVVKPADTSRSTHPQISSDSDVKAPK